MPRLLPDTLDGWLAHCERLHPHTIDMTLERVARVRDRLGLGFGATVVITVAGTNGKGSTCAMIEAIALQAGYRCGVYTSPHLVHFEERCRIAGCGVDAQALLPHFEAVEAARGGEALTYFEFTTLVILCALAQARLDLVVLEVGLGGRLDAVNVIDADAVVITGIDIDHVEYLGPDRESIGLEKAHVMRSGRAAVVSDPSPPASVVRHAQAIGADLWLLGRDHGHEGDRQQWQWWGRGRRWRALAPPALRGANQVLNACGAMAVLEALRPRLPVNAQAVRNGLALVELPGRFQIVPGRPTVVLDVAHNPQAVATLAVNLDAMGFFPRTHAVFGAMADKDIAAMLGRLSGLIDAWYLCDLPTSRALPASELMARVPARQGLPEAVRVAVSSPAEAMAAAVAAADPADRIVVFGSFYTVGGVLQAGWPGRQARHVA